MTDQEFRLLEAEDMFGVIVRGHLYVESDLIALLERALDASAINLARLTFPFKVELAAAIGLLRKEEMAPYMVLNKLRNRLAHDVRAEVLESDEKDFRSVLWQPMLEWLDKIASEPLSVRLATVVFSLCYLLENRKKAVIEEHEKLAEIVTRIRALGFGTKDREAHKS